jgi:hypothetical protein
MFSLYSLWFPFSVAGKDVVPRVGLHQLETLRHDLMDAIKRSKKNKVSFYLMPDQKEWGHPRINNENAGSGDQEKDARIKEESEVGCLSRQDHGKDVRIRKSGVECQDQDI